MVGDYVLDRRSTLHFGLGFVDVVGEVVREDRDRLVVASQYFCVSCHKLRDHLALIAAAVVLELQLVEQHQVLEFTVGHRQQDLWVVVLQSADQLVDVLFLAD